LRFCFNSPKARFLLGLKFGCDPINEAPDLLKLAKHLGLNVVGVSFHVGSSNEDYQVYCEAIAAARKLFTIAHHIGFNLRILDIGGGFFGDSFDRIYDFSPLINEALDSIFPIEQFPELKIFAEPGR
jgi:ornithine decarboxylase